MLRFINANKSEAKLFQLWKFRNSSVCPSETLPQKTPIFLQFWIGFFCKSKLLYKTKIIQNHSSSNISIIRPFTSIDMSNNIQLKGSTCILLPVGNPFTFRKKQLLFFFYNIILKLYFKKGQKKTPGNNKTELTTTPNCSGSDKLLYSFLNLDNAFSCSCSGRCFIKFYKEK